MAPRREAVLCLVWQAQPDPREQVLGQAWALTGTRTQRDVKRADLSLKSPLARGGVLWGAGTPETD